MTNTQPEQGIPQVVRPGKYVSLTYRITDASGTVLEQADLPVGYIHGGNSELIGGMDDAVVGAQAGDDVYLELRPGQGFGVHDPNLTFTEAVENVPPEFRFVGAEVPMQNESGDVRTFYVTRIESGKLTVDGNHPLAGKALKVHVEIQEVRDPTADELYEDGSRDGSLPGGTLH